VSQQHRHTLQARLFVAFSSQLAWDEMTSETITHQVLDTAFDEMDPDAAGRQSV
jgi:hypothetical protein